jgi:alkaline phosphatase
MGLSAASSAFYYSDSLPNLSRFNDIGLINTSSASHKITDSGAGGTAFAIGEKTYNGAIGMGLDSLPRKNIVEILSEKSYATGLVVTCQLPHATPASFYAHVKLRYQYEDIAKQFVYTELDYFAGGGYQYFSQRSDSINYLDSLEQHGFSVDTNSLKVIPEDISNTKLAYLLAPKAMKSMSKGRTDFLPKATQNALDFLDKNKTGFFLMVEGSQIDWEAHDNNADGLIQEVLDFDKAIGVALDYAQTNDHTLVVVLADHETGGFTLAASSSSEEKYGDYNTIEPKFATGEHSTSLVPVFAYGKGSENFRGIYQNNDIFHKLINVATE